MKQQQRIETDSACSPSRLHQPQSQLPEEYNGASSRSVLRRTPPSARLTTDVHVHRHYHSHPAANKSIYRTPKPLVLDASSSSSVSTTTPYSTSLAPPTATSSTNFLRSIWKERKPSLQNHKHYPFALAASSLSSGESQPGNVGLLYRNGAVASETFHPSDPSSSVDGVTAATVAREAAHAGFLCKLGQNVQAWKRRFFVLERPRANLYYFLSPHDSSPRGCLDLEGAQIAPLEDKSDVWRLEVYWPETGKSILLEARSEDVRDEWVHALRAHQFTAVEHELHQTQHRLSACHSRIGEVEHELKQFKLVEQELQASQQEAKEWKAKFQLLDESLRRLSQQLRRTHADEALQRIDSQPPGEEQMQLTSAQTPPESNGVSEQLGFPADEEGCDEGTLTSPMRESSLLDASLHDEYDVWNVPGAHFSGLVNSCEQLQQTVRLSQQEATQAVADCREAEKKVELIQKRMEKAEKHLCKIWEENCALRRELRQKKRERQVLVREVKVLREASTSKAKEKESHRYPEPEDADASYSNGVDEDEVQLLNELEAHVLSSIRLHEQLIGTQAAFNGPTSANTNAAILEEKGLRVEESASAPMPSLGGPHSRSDSVATTATATSASAAASQSSHELPLPKPIASLFDGDSESGDDAECNASVAASISSMVAEADSVGDSQRLRLHSLNDLTRTEKPRTTIGGNMSTVSSASTPERPNPVLDLDERPLSLQDVVSVKEPPPVVTNNGHATSKLHCPLADVVESSGNLSDAKRPQRYQVHELQVYHLTFYSRKIGLQFQKVPPPPAKSTGLLNDAITADLCGTSNDDGSKTAAELRRIVAISSSAKADQENPSKDEFCEVAQPVDAVVVCGFVGFDDTGSNVRPRLGARLVAFDGVSVERGLWTFESIRKAIQARDRPLTLSFRNDFLTTEQRSILTKAITDAQGYSQLPRQYLNLDTLQRRPSCEPSVHSTLTHESENFASDAYVTPSREDDLSGRLSVRSDASGDDQGKRYAPHAWTSSANCVASPGRRDRHSFRSFSDAGSSVSMISAVAPLISNLLHRSSAEPFTPDYLLRKPEPVEQTPQHQDFQSELL